MESLSRTLLLFALLVLSAIYVNHGAAGVRLRLRTFFLGRA